MIGLLPLCYGGMTTDYSASHTGIDVGWLTGSSSAEIYCPILSWRDGVVVNVGYDASLRGNYCTIRHQNGNVYQYTNYIHLRDVPMVKVGESVKLGQQIGVRGTTGKSTGVHLHFAVSKETNDATKQTQWVADNSVNPKTCCYRSEAFTYKLGSSMDWCTYANPQPTQRDEKVHQYEVTIPDLYWRKGASRSAEKYSQYVTMGIYNVLEQVNDGTYVWNKIAENYWFAGAYADGTDTHGKDYPIEDIEALKKKVAELTKANEELLTKCNELIEINVELDSKLDKIREIVSN